MDDKMSTPEYSSRIPLYLRLADTMRDRIRKGLWAQDKAIPTLEDLASEFNVARLTARQAVQLLMQEGLLSPQRGKGTFVTSPPEARKSITLETSLADLARMYESTTPQILTISEANALPPVPAGTGDLGNSYAYMKRVHSTEGAPYSVIALYLLEEIFALAPDEFRSKAVIPVLLRLARSRLVKAHQTMTIGAADAETAQLLRVPAGTPVAEVARVFKDRDDKLIYFANVSYRGDWVQWEIDLKP